MLCWLKNTLGLTACLIKCIFSISIILLLCFLQGTLHNIPGDVALWTNHRVMEWLRTIDLSEYAPNMRGSGVHGALMVKTLFRAYQRGLSHVNTEARKPCLAWGDSYNTI
jgi:hypothetical protein